MGKIRSGKKILAEKKRKQKDLKKMELKDMKQVEIKEAMKIVDEGEKQLKEMIGEEEEYGSLISEINK